MEIKDNILVMVTDEEIINGTFNIPDNIKIIGSEAFLGCELLEEIIIPNSITNIEPEAFSNCESLKKIKLSESLSKIEDSTFFGCIHLEEIVIPNGVTEIADNAFSLCSKLKNITLSDVLISIGENAFGNCIALEEIIIPESVTNIGKEAFRSCESLKKIILPKNIDRINIQTFYACKKLKEIELPESVTEIAPWAFQCCESLEKINFPKKLSTIGYFSFAKCVSLSEITLPDDLIYIGEGAFSECQKIKEIIIPKKIKYIEGKTFENCSSLENVELPDGLEIIKESAFYKTALTTIKLPDTLTEIGVLAFAYCYWLSDLYIHKNIKKIGFNALLNCNGFEDGKLCFESSLINFDFKVFCDWRDVVTFTLYNKEVKIFNRANLNIDKVDPIFHEIKVLELLDKIYEKLVQNNHIYNLTREDLNKFYDENSNFYNIINMILEKIVGEDTCDYDYYIEKFDKLFPNVRFSNLPNSEIFENLTLELAEKYNVKIIRELEEFKIFDMTYETRKNIIDVVALFGLFENDKFVYNRLNIVKRLFKPDFYCLSVEDYQLLHRKVPFLGIDTMEYFIKYNVHIPVEFDLYLKRHMKDFEVKLIKEMDKSYGKKINDFFRENYIRNPVPYCLISQDVHQIRDIIFKSRVNNQITIESLNRIFNNIPKIYDENIMNFIVKYFDIILSNSEYQSEVRNIIKSYYEIELFYKSKGNNKINFIDALDFLNKVSFSNVNVGNYEFAELVKNAGLLIKKHLKNIKNYMKI